MPVEREHPHEEQREGEAARETHERRLVRVRVWLG
jgi:hypothetical protein